MDEILSREETDSIAYIVQVISANVLFAITTAAIFLPTAAFHFILVVTVDTPVARH
jgi:hypothetical protein